MAQQFSGLPMDSLIGGPLNAAADGNAKMAMTQTKFMLDTCFTKENGNYKPIMIKMSLDRAVINEKDGGDVEIKTATTAFNLPLITIIPLNSLGVDEVDIKFEMEVKSSSSTENTQESNTKMAAEASFEAKFGAGPFSVSVKGSASYSKEDKSSSKEHYQKSNSAKYTVHVHAGQLPLPQGVTTIIDAFSKSIEPIQVGQPKAPDEGSHEQTH